MTRQSERDSRIAPLDGWRTISVALVIISHLTAFSSIKLSVPGRLGRAVIIPILKEIGPLGVSIFFVISGYVIVGGLIREYARADRVSLFSFYVRRVFRILPPLLMYVLAVMALAQANLIPPFASGVVKALTFTCNLGTDCGGWFGAHTWSLSYEEQFYLVIPVLFAVLWKSRRSAFILLPAVLGVLTLCSYPFSEIAADLFGHFVAISTGVAWAAAEQDVLRICKRLPGYVVSLIPIVLIASVRLTHTRFWPVGLLVSPPIITVMLVHSTFISKRMAGALSKPWLTYIGRSSYSIYLWQQLATYGFSGASVSFYLVSVTLCVLLAAASYKWIETPLIRISHSISRRVSLPAEANAL